MYKWIFIKYFGGLVIFSTLTYYFVFSFYRFTVTNAWAVSKDYENRLWGTMINGMKYSFMSHVIASIHVCLRKTYNLCRVHQSSKRFYLCQSQHIREKQWSLYICEIVKIIFFLIWRANFILPFLNRLRRLTFLTYNFCYTHDKMTADSNWKNVIG